MAAVAPSPDRTLPHNLEAERSVLGAILLHNDAFNAAAEVIDAGDFFRDAHRRIFDNMVKLAERGDAIDLVTLKEELGRSAELDEVGGPAYIAALVDGVPRSTNVKHYARIIKEKATLRSLISSANKILVNAYEGGEVFRGGCCYQRGAGRVFYFSPGDQEYPVYHQPEVQRVIANAVAWCGGRSTANDLPSARQGRSERNWYL